MQNFYDELVNYRAHLQTELKSRHSPIRTISAGQPISFPAARPSFAVLRPPATDDSAVTETDYNELAEKLGSLQFGTCRKCPIHQRVMQNPPDFNDDHQQMRKLQQACSSTSSVSADYNYSIPRQGSPASFFFTCLNPRGRNPVSRQFGTYSTLFNQIMDDVDRLTDDELMIKYSQAAAPPPEARILMSIYEQAKDPNASAMLQRLIDGGMNADEFAAIYDGIIGHVTELAENSFANYLVQKIIDNCGDDRRMTILLKLTNDPRALIRIALNDYGTRVVQKLIGRMKTAGEAAVISGALKHGILALIKDINGSHVIQNCLLHLPPEYNQYIFDATAKNCVSVAMDRYGSRVLLTCITNFFTSTGPRDNTNKIGVMSCQLLPRIASHALHLAQDAFGNYIVQSILDVGDRKANAILVYEFRGNYVELCKHKFSSNVVERCVDVFGEDDRAALILELLCSPQFPHLLHHPYANYVILRALRVTKGSSLYGLTVEAVLPHAEALKDSPYFKQIHRLISRNSLR